MNRWIGQNDKIYTMEKAENFLCVPAVLHSVLESEGYHSLDLYQIAEYFGINVPEGYDIPFVHNISHVQDERDYGVVLNNDSVNHFFSRFDIPLEEKYVGIGNYDRDLFSDAILENLLVGNHLICGYNYFGLNNQPGYIGHVSIIIRVDRNRVAMINPGPKGYGLIEVDSYQLHSAIYDARNGLWIISEKKDI